MNARKSIKTSKLSIAAFHEEPFLSQAVNSQNKPFYCYVYKITNLKEGLFYYGSHRTVRLNDGYPGSSINVKKDINRLGTENFKKEILKFFETIEEMIQYEQDLIRPELNNPNCYNRGITPAFNVKGVLVKDTEEKNFYYVKVDDPRIGKTLFYPGIGKVSVVDKDGNTFQTSIDDQRYLSGELVAPNKGQVTVKTEDGWINISKEEYQKNKDKYITPTKNKISVKYKGRENEKGFSIPIEEYKKNPDLYVSATKGWLIVRNKKDGSLKVIKKEDMTEEFEPFSKGKTVVKDKEGNTFYVDVDDPRYVSGELRFFREGKKWMHKGNKKIQVDPDKVEEKLKEGWEIGLMQDGYYWVTKDGINKKIEKPLLEEYLRAGWRKGAAQIKKRWVTKDNISKSVLESEYENYLKDGWKPGMKTNLKWVSKGEEKKMVPKEEVEKYLRDGWKIGMPKVGSWMSRGDEKKLVLEKEIDEHLKNGWIFGKKTNLRWMTAPNGERKMIKLENINSYLDKGWILSQQSKKKKKPHHRLLEQ